MARSINAGVIASNMKADFFDTVSSNKVEEFNWKKIYVSDMSSSPHINKSQAEIVTNAEAVINDSNIALVFVSANHLDLVKLAMEAGKSVRII